MPIADTDRLTIVAVLGLLLFGVLFLRYASRRFRGWRGRRRPGYRPELGRYGGRFFASSAGLLASLLLLVVAVHLSSWQAFDQSATIGTVKASGRAGAITLAIKLRSLPERTVALTGRHWVIRGDLILFPPRYRVIGLRNYFRARAADGLSSPTERLAGTPLSHEELQPPSWLFALLSRLPSMPWIFTVKSDATPIKDPGADVTLFVTPSGMAG